MTRPPLAGPGRLLVALLAILGALVASSGARPASAGPQDVTVANVVGTATDVARQTLEAQGLAVALVEVAGPQPGRVDRQEPPAGARVPTGTEVTLRVGIALRIDTRVPEVRGRKLAEVGPELGHAYVLEVELVPGGADQDGMILDQNPAAGQTLWFRGVLALRVIQAPAPSAAGVIVPTLLGRTEAQATDVLQALGLSVGIEYVTDPAQAAGTVVSQDPAAGAQILSGSTVSLRVVGAPDQPPPGPAAGVPVPTLAGLAMNAAIQELVALGLVPQIQFQTASGPAPWSCIQQDPAPGTPVAAGSAVTLVIALPAPQPAQVTVPTLFGLSQSQASALLATLGLNAVLQQAVAGYPPGMVFAQDPTAGSQVPRGASVKAIVSIPPPGGGTQPAAPVPNVVGLSAAQAFVALQQAGFMPKGKLHLAPNKPVNVVESQSPGAGFALPPGAEVRFYLPFSSNVPTLIGKTKGDAIQALQMAGFNPEPQGPAFGLGTTVVIAQGAPAGVPLARGSGVAFAFKFQGGGPIPVKVQVPDVTGLNKNAAAATLQQKGLGVDLQHQGPYLPGPGTKVVSQNPPPGALVNPNQVVTVVYVDVIGPPGSDVIVPSLMGLTLQTAQQALQASGLQGVFQLQGPPIPGVTKVVSQQPGPGQKVAKGSTVTVGYVQQIVPLTQVAVPTLLNLSVSQAQGLLANASLQGNFVLQGPAFPNGVKKVIGQQPAPNSLVNKGSVVTVTYVQQPPGPPPSVIVPKVTGFTRPQAKASLEALGLTALFSGPPGNPSKQRVISQSPAQGQQVPVGATVTMVVINMP